MKEIVLLLPDHAKEYLLPGLGIGLVAWIVSSPLLGQLIGYDTGALLGQLAGGIAVGMYSSNRVYTKTKYPYVSWIGILIFSGIYFTGFTVLLKSFIDAQIGSASASHYALAYMAAFAIISMIVAGLAESLAKIKSKADA